MLNGDTAEALVQLSAIVFIAAILIATVVGITVARWLSKWIDRAFDYAKKRQEEEEE